MRNSSVTALTVVVMSMFVGATSGDEKAEPGSAADCPEAKQTLLGLYATATEAYEKWKAAPEEVKILDVRTPEEYIFVGHATMAWNIPLAFQSYQWDSDKQRFAMQPNADFVSQVKEWAEPTETILVMCRSGGRGAMAVNQLAESGFTNVYNIIDGMEGDKVDDLESVFHGKMMTNGWKNSGLPWTYEIDPERMRLPTSRLD
jgi:rhodanese-related sulfurtransferase